MSNHVQLAWFVYSNDVVTGPFSTEDVRVKMQTGLVNSNCYIWWKGQREWMPITAWESQLGQILKSAAEPTQPVWYIDLGGAPIGPLTQREMIDNLKGVSNLNPVKLWATGMSKWSSVYELYDVMEMLGISRRENARAPLMGTVAINRSTDDPKGYVVRAASISIAGMGIAGVHDLRKGDEVTLLIKSPDFKMNLHLRAEVAYVTSNGYAGLRFYKVPAETQTLIFDHVKRFHQDLASTKAA